MTFTCSGARAVASEEKAPREIPIHLPTETIRALLTSRVTQLRFPVQGRPRFAYACADARGQLTGDFFVSMQSDATRGIVGQCPFGQPGDILWVREDWQTATDGSLRYRIQALAEHDEDAKWCPAISMPRSASRLSVVVVSASVSRLRTMTQKDARAHGYVSVPGKSALEKFREGWDATNPRTPCSADPWAWILEVNSVIGACAATA